MLTVTSFVGPDGGSKLGVERRKFMAFSVKSKFRLEVRCLERNKIVCSVPCPVPVTLPLSSYHALS